MDFFVQNDYIQIIPLVGFCFVFVVFLGRRGRFDQIKYLCINLHYSQHAKHNLMSYFRRLTASDTLRFLCSKEHSRQGQYPPCFGANYRSND